MAQHLLRDLDTREGTCLSQLRLTNRPPNQTLHWTFDSWDAGQTQNANLLWMMFGL
jgi:hypothetical protein